MSDCEKLTKQQETEPLVELTPSAPKVLSEKDDFSGMTLNMVKKIDVREIFILWITFIALHFEIFSVHVLSKFKGTTNEDKTMTLKGTIYASVFMIIMVILCRLIF